MPNSMIVLDIGHHKIRGEIRIPLGELQSAIGMNVNDNSKNLIPRLGNKIKLYLHQHIRIIGQNGKVWEVILGDLDLVETKSKLTGDYKEIIIKAIFLPPNINELRHFVLHYDVVLHQVITHKILVYVKYDWQQGIVTEDKSLQYLGIIELDIPTGKVNPFEIKLSKGGTWQGFKSMISLGINHIIKGIDHMLFIITLIIPALFLSKKNRWTVFVNSRKNIFNLVKIISAFTIGHSMALILGVFQWKILPLREIEILIAGSILISAIHAFRPLYTKKEMYIAAGFGLIHGLAFSETLTSLELSNKQLILSVLGFNLGIEFMQIFIVLLIFLILILVNKTAYLSIFRQILAVVIMIFALGWFVERIVDKPNFITEILQ